MIVYEDRSGSSVVELTEDERNALAEALDGASIRLNLATHDDKLAAKSLLSALQKLGYNKLQE